MTSVSQNEDPELPNTVMELTATFAACAALPRTCFRMSAAHHHVGLVERA